MSALHASLLIVLLAGASPKRTSTSINPVTKQAHQQLLAATVPLGKLLQAGSGRTGVARHLTARGLLRQQVCVCMTGSQVAQPICSLVQTYHVASALLRRALPDDDHATSRAALNSR